MGECKTVLSAAHSLSPLQYSSKHLKSNLQNITDFQSIKCYRIHYL